MHAALVDAGGARSVLAQLLRRTARASSNKAFTTEHLYNHRVGYIESSQARSRCLKLGKASSPAPGRYCALPSPALAVMSAKRPRTIDAFFVRKPSAVGGASARQKCADSAVSGEGPRLRPTPYPNIHTATRTPHYSPNRELYAHLFSSVLTIGCHQR